MNASDEYDVHALWSQIPEAARPAGLAWHDVLECFTGDVEIADSMGHDGSGGIFKVKMHPEAVAKLLVASMVDYLLVRGPLEFDPTANVTLDYVCVKHGDRQWRGASTLVEALAAACKVVGT